MVRSRRFQVDDARFHNGGDEHRRGDGRLVEGEVPGPPGDRAFLGLEGRRESGVIEEVRCRVAFRDLVDLVVALGSGSDLELELGDDENGSRFLFRGLVERRKRKKVRPRPRTEEGQDREIYDRLGVGRGSLVVGRLAIKLERVLVVDSLEVECPFDDVQLGHVDLLDADRGLLKESRQSEGGLGRACRHPSPSVEDGRRCRRRGERETSVGLICVGKLDDGRREGGD